MDESERFSTRHDEIADSPELSTKDDVGNISVESQQSGFRKFEEENSEIIMDNSNENGTFSVSQGSRFIILQERNPLGAGSSGFHGDVSANFSADKDAIGFCLSTKSVSKPHQDSENAVCDSNVEELKIPDHLEMLTSPYYDQNEYQLDSPLFTSVNDVWNRDLLYDNDALTAAFIEGNEKESLNQTGISMPISYAEDCGFSNMQRDDDQKFILRNSEESQNHILTGIASPRRSELLNTSVSVNNTEGVAGPSSMNINDQSYLKDGRFVCRECGKSFSRKSNYDAHYKIHPGEENYACDICGILFSQKSDLNMHLRIHTGEERYACETCGKLFYRKGHLMMHLRTHTREKPFACDTCGKTFSQQSFLIRHLRIHTGEKPYKCPICGKSFSTNSNCKRHTENVHKKK